MHSTFLRREHIHGLLLGVAIGDALGLPRENLCRRRGLKMFGRGPLRYQLSPGQGIYSDDTQLMLLTAQALLQSRSDGKAFRWIFQKRLSWYLLSFPVGAGRATLISAAKCWLMRLRLPSGVNSAGNGAATRALINALAIHGTGHRLSRWVEESTKLTHTHPLASDGCRVLAALADHGATCKPDVFVAQAALAVAINASSTEDIKNKLSELQSFLEQRRSPSAVARHFGWDQHVSGFIVPTTIMATYCWLRHPSDFRRAVESAVLLGGDTDSVAAIVGGLVGAHVGARRLPTELVNGISGISHGPAWIEKLAERLSHWPHGRDDLHSAPCQSTDPIGQLVRNAWTTVLVLTHVALRAIYRATTSCTPRRDRRQVDNSR
ncbi:MAG: ADP-ribosylglycohydrolase family protein [Aureliella sp.]